MSLLNKLKKEKYVKQNFQLPESLSITIQDYVDFGKTKGVEVDTSELATEALKQILSGEKEFQSWLKNKNQ